MVLFSQTSLVQAAITTTMVSSRAEALSDTARQEGSNLNEGYYLSHFMLYKNNWGGSGMSGVRLYFTHEITGTTNNFLIGS